MGGRQVGCQHCHTPSHFGVTLVGALVPSGRARGPNIRYAFTSGWSQGHPRATFEKLPRSVPEVYIKPVFLDVPGMFLKINLKMHGLDFISSTPLARHDRCQGNP